MEMVSISEVPRTLPQIWSHNLAGMSMMGYGNIAKEEKDLNFVRISLLHRLDTLSVMHSTFTCRIVMSFSCKK